MASVSGPPFMSALEPSLATFPGLWSVVASCLKRRTQGSLLARSSASLQLSPSHPRLIGDGQLPKKLDGPYDASHYDWGEAVYQGECERVGGEEVRERSERWRPETLKRKGEQLGSDE